MHTLRFLIIVLLAIAPKSTFSQQVINDNQKLATFIKVWGFLKYYHPAAYDEHADWDSEFINRYHQLSKINDAITAKSFFTRWVDSLNTTPCISCIARTDSDFNFIDSAANHAVQNTFLGNDDSFQNSLLSVSGRYFSLRNKYVVYHWELPDFLEDPRTDNPYPPQEERLLALARYWNLINYYYPYMELLDTPWEQTFQKILPLFISAKNKEEYFLAIAKMTKGIPDTHIAGLFNKTYSYWGNYVMPIGLRIIENKIAVTTEWYGNEIADKYNLKQGDIIEAINNIPVKTLADSFSKYITASNEAGLNKTIAIRLCFSRDSMATINIDRQGKKITTSVKCFKLKDLKSKGTAIRNEKNKWRLINKDIGYIHSGVEYHDKEFKAVLKKLRNCKTIIIDSRGGGSIHFQMYAKYFSRNSVPFWKCFYPTEGLPGKKRGVIYSLGKNQRPYFKGKLILLVNEITQSAGETDGFVFKTFPNATIIGSQTAGTDGNTQFIKLPGGYSIVSTFLGITYPDESQFQRIGVVPDIYVNITLKGITDGRDEILERAIEFANDGK